MTDLFGIVALLGFVATVVGTIALVKGRLPAVGIRDRKSAGILTAIGFSWLVFGGMLLPSDDSESSQAAASSSTEQVARDTPTVSLNLNGGPHSLVDQDVMQLTGSTDPGASIEASWAGGGHATAVADPSGTFSVQVGPLSGTGETVVNVRAFQPGKESASAMTTVNRTISEASFKAKSTTVPYDQLKKDPDALKGTLVTYKGRVFQYDSRTSTASMIVSVTNKGYGFWSDEMFLVLDPALGQNADEDDLIQFWGTITGSFTYDTAIGGSNTLPAVAVQYLTVTAKK
jgi:hypothetical protein